METVHVYCEKIKNTYKQNKITPWLSPSQSFGKFDYRHKIHSLHTQVWKNGNIASVLNFSPGSGKLNTVTYTYNQSGE